ncbi:hypothetical protein [Janthinobacterium sp. HLS12-2]|uniref:hypothetical protein n=1 Tax=Janthinobacterium sp. HLS12-2 TaxID=1259324 RepID=UPI003F278397
MRSLEERKIIYYLPFLETATVVEFSKFKITPFFEKSEYGDLRPKGIFEGNGSLIEVNGFKSGDFYTREVDRLTFIVLERLKFGYFLYNPPHVMSHGGYVSSENFECFRLIETNEDPSFEHKVYLSNGIYNFSESLKTYYESRVSLKHRKISARKDFNLFTYVDFLSENITDEDLLTAMRLYNRCWSTYSLHNSLDKPIFARSSIEILAKNQYGEKNGLKKFISEFFNKSFAKLDELSNSDETIKRLTALVTPNRIELENVVTEHLERIKMARHSYAHAGVETEELTNMPFYLLWFPLFWIVLLNYEKMTPVEGIRLGLFFCLLKVNPERWQHIDFNVLPSNIKYPHIRTYAHYSRILPIWAKTNPEETDMVLKAIPKWFDI